MSRRKFEHLARGAGRVRGRYRRTRRKRRRKAGRFDDEILPLEIATNARASRCVFDTDEFVRHGDDRSTRLPG
jgi:hypothetical protein